MKLSVLLLIFAVLFVLSIWLGQIVWAWVVPDVFSGLVVQGLLPKAITFSQSFKLMVLLWAFIGTSSKK